MKFFARSLVALALAGTLVPVAGLAQTPLTLKDALKGSFHIGVAINEGIIRETDKEGAAIVTREFDSITPENALKWEALHPTVAHYEFDLADRYVAFGVQHHLYTIGHTLLWHEQVPANVFQKSSPDADLAAEVRERLIDHITTVVSRYRGRVAGWDVVNEAIDDEGKLRTNKPWYALLGEEAIFLAFETAHRADPNAELYYNEYSLWNKAKRDTVIDLVKRLRARGLRVDGVGLQEHMMVGSPTIPEVEAVFNAFHDAGIKVMVTELDVSVLPRPDNYSGADVSRKFTDLPKYNPYVTALPDSVDQALADYYGQLFALYRRHAADLKRVTLWGVSDTRSWLNHWPIRGRTDYPLLYDRSYKPKKAFTSILEALSR